MLKEIKIENFKSLKHLEMKCTKLNLLMGLNGSGKSSFIQALRFINEFDRGFSMSGPKTVCEFINLNSDLFKVGTYKDLLYSYAGKKKEDRKALIVARSFEKDTQVSLLIEPKVWCIDYMNLPECAVRYVEAVSEYKKCPDLTYEEYKFDGDTLMVRENLISTLRSVCINSYLSSDRIAPTLLHESDENLNLTDDSSGRRSASVLANMWGLYVDPWCYHPSCKSELLIDQVNAWLNVISPGANVDVKKIPDFSMVSMFFTYDRRRNAPRFRPSNVGFGLSYILPMLVGLLTSHEGQSLVIENPEAHLHPRGQSEIGKLLAKAAAAGIQLFVETHSDHVINGIRVAVKEGPLQPDDVNIAFFERKPHEKKNVFGEPETEIYSTVTDIKIDKNGSMSMYPDGFMDEWNNRLMELLA